MEIKLDTLTFTTKQIGKPLKGFTAPKIRTSQANFAGRDGGYVSGQFYAPREIVIPLHLKESNCADLEETRQAIASIPIRQDLDMYVTSFGGTTRYTSVRLLDVDGDIEERFFFDPVLTLVASDPYFYDAGDGSDPDTGWTEQTIYKIIGGGYVTPYILPIEWEEGATPSVVTNNGEITVYPQIILEDQWTNPVITNITTGFTVELNVTTTTGDIIIIDQNNQTVTLNGGNILPSRDAISSSWWGLIPGNNTISVTSDSVTDASTAIIRYKQGYLSI